MKRPSSLERAHFARIVELGCLVCGREATVHHVTGSIHGGRLIRRHDRVVPLCPIHHQIQHDPYVNDPQSVERLGHQGFWKKYGIDLLKEAERLAQDIRAVRMERDG